MFLSCKATGGVSRGWVAKVADTPGSTSFQSTMAEVADDWTLSPVSPGDQLHHPGSIPTTPVPATGVGAIDYSTQLRPHQFP